MPQLMPLNWMISFLMGLFIVIMIVDFYEKDSNMSMNIYLNIYTNNIVSWEW